MTRLTKPIKTVSSKSSSTLNKADLPSLKTSKTTIILKCASGGSGISKSWYEWITQVEDLSTAISNHLENYWLTLQLRFDLNKENQTIKQILLNDDKTKDLNKQELKDMIEKIKNQEIELTTYLKEISEIDPIEISEFKKLNFDADFVKDSLTVEKLDSQKKSVIYYGFAKSSTMKQLYKAMTGSIL